MNLFKETGPDLGLIWYQNNYSPSPNWAGAFLILKHKHLTCLMFTIPRRAASDGSPAIAKEKEQTGKHQTFTCCVLWCSWTMLIIFRVCISTEVTFDHASACEISCLWNCYGKQASVWSCDRKSVLLENRLKLPLCLQRISFLLH